MDPVNVLILGAGGAGYTAAIYAARANLAPVLLAGPEPGGQLTLTTMVENYPGFRDGVMGPDLMEEMRKQAERFGTKIVQRAATKVDLATRPFRIEAEGEVYHAKALIVATGASANLLGLPSEKQFMGRGVSTCATCDGYFFKGQDVAVVGGGDSALEEALYLANLCSKVTVIHRRDKLRASKIVQDRAQKHSKIAFRWNTVVEEILGTDQGVSGVRLKQVGTEEQSELKVSGLFIAIGHSPNTGIFRGQLDMDEQGYLKTQDGTRTTIPGVFAAGDVQDRVYRQAVTAAGSGCMAAIDAERWLEEQGE
ncbi:MAG: thioredoxin-disulfide reductase [Candidatus Methylomirabilales bacterium]